MNWLDTSLFIAVQVWKLQPDFREEVDDALRMLRSYKGPTIAFHGE